MNIAFDGKRAVSNMTGLGNYSRSLIGALAQYYPDNRYIILAPKMRHHQAIDELLQMDNVTADTPKHTAFGHIWRSGCGIIRSALRAKAEIYHGLSAELPLGIARSGMKSVVTVHDLIYHHYPERYNKIDRLIYDTKTKHALQCADRIVTVSQFTKDDVVNTFGTDATKIHVIHPAIDHNYFRPITEADRNELRHVAGLAGRYILAVGRLVDYKNLLLAIESLALLKDKDVKLVIVGKPNDYWNGTIYPIISKRHVTDRVVLVPWIPPELMPALYATAHAVVFPSLCEGFGLPVLEAQQCGTPVLCANTSSLPEAGGDAACFFDPRDANELAQHIDHVLADEQYANDLRRKGLAHAALFTPQLMAGQMARLYRDLIES